MINDNIESIDINGQRGTVFIKPDKKSSTTRFRSAYPSTLYGIIEPTEYEETIQRINKLVELYKAPKWSYVLLIPLAIIGLILIITDLFKRNRALFLIGALLALISLFSFFIIIIYYKRKNAQQLYHAIAEANTYYNLRGIRFSLTYKRSKHALQSKSGGGLQWTYIKIDYPVNQQAQTAQINHQTSVQQPSFNQQQTSPSSSTFVPYSYPSQQLSNHTFYAQHQIYENQQQQYLLPVGDEVESLI